MSVEYSRIHEKYFVINPIVQDLITETEQCTSMNELNDTIQRGLYRLKTVN